MVGYNLQAGLKQKQQHFAAVFEILITNESLFFFHIGCAQVNGNCADHDYYDGMPDGYSYRGEQTEHVQQTHGYQQDADNQQGCLGLTGLLQGNPQANQTDNNLDSGMPGGFSAHIDAGDER
jgi:hypothetical protein